MSVALCGLEDDRSGVYRHLQTSHRKSELCRRLLETKSGEKERLQTGPATDGPRRDRNGPRRGPGLDRNGSRTALDIRLAGAMVPVGYGVAATGVATPGRIESAYSLVRLDPDSSALGTVRSKASRFERTSNTP
jgi:hypothetical protein